jgi:D-sedoheptulose 7-phosphate isomerase
MPFLKNLAQKAFEDSLQTKTNFMNTCLEPLVEMAQALATVLQNGGRIFFCGNGGSAADAQHLAAELLIRYRSSHNRQSLPAISLALDPSTLTACGNDYGYDDIFSRPLEGLGQKGDALVGLTTSGRSPNVLKAFEVAKQKGILTCGFLGGEGRPARDYCDHSLVVPSTVTARIQECHITAGHIVMELIEDILQEKGYLKLSS